jgi:nucleotide-binding universal stress UspA family protein
MKGGDMRINKVLVPVDFSPASTLAVNHGIALARKFRAKLTLLHVVETATALLYTFPTEAEKVERQRLEQAEKMLPVLVGPEDQDDLDVKFLVQPGDVEEIIEKTVHDEKADAVVMGTHGRSIFGRLLIGSVTQGLLRKLGVPVLTVCHVSRPLEFKRILFGTDLGFGSEKAFDFALQLAKITGATLVIAHTIDKRPVVNYETPEVTAVFNEEHQQAVQYARDRFAEFEKKASGLEVQVEFVLGEGDAAAALVRIADEVVADLMILALRKRSAVSRTLLGTVAEPVIRNAHLPVFSVPVDTEVAEAHHRPLAEASGRRIL